MDDLEVRDLEPMGLWRILRRRAALLLGVVLVMVALGAGLSLRQPTRYKASTIVLYRTQVVAAANGDASPTLQEQQDLLTSQVKSAQSTDMRDRVKRDLPFPATLEAAAGDGPDLIRLSATSTTAKRSVTASKAYAKAFIAAEKASPQLQYSAAIASLQTAIDKANLAISELPRPGASSAQQRALLTAQLTASQRALAALNVRLDVAAPGAAVVVSAATAPTSAEKSPLAQNLVIALLAGLVLGVAAAAVAERFDRRVREPSELARSLGDARMLGTLDTGSATAEQGRGLALAVQQVIVRADFGIVHVTCARTEDGAAAVASALAVAYAREGRDVLLVDCDISREPGSNVRTGGRASRRWWGGRDRRHDPNSLFGPSERAGLVQVLLGEASAMDAAQPVKGVASLSILGAGSAPAGSHDVLATPRTRQVLGELAQQRLLILVSAPILAVSDGRVLAQYADATLLVARADVTHRDDVIAAKEVLAQIGAVSVGGVLFRGRPSGIRLPDDDNDALVRRLVSVARREPPVEPIEPVEPVAAEGVPTSVS